MTTTVTTPQEKIHYCTDSPYYGTRAQHAIKTNRNVNLLRGFIEYERALNTYNELDSLLYRDANNWNVGDILMSEMMTTRIEEEMEDLRISMEIFLKDNLDWYTAEYRMSRAAVLDKNKKERKEKL